MASLAIPSLASVPQLFSIHSVTLAAFSRSSAGCVFPSMTRSQYFLYFLFSTKASSFFAAVNEACSFFSCIPSAKIMPQGRCCPNFFFSARATSLFRALNSAGCFFGCIPSTKSVSQSRYCLRFFFSTITNSFFRTVLCTKSLFCYTPLAPSMSDSTNRNILTFTTIITHTYVNAVLCASSNL